MYIRTQTRLCTTGRMLKVDNYGFESLPGCNEIVFHGLDFAFRPLGADVSMRKYHSVHVLHRLKHNIMHLVLTGSCFPWTFLLIRNGFFYQV